MSSLRRFIKIKEDEKSFEQFLKDYNFIILSKKRYQQMIENKDLLTSIGVFNKESFETFKENSIEVPAGKIGVICGDDDAIWSIDKIDDLIDTKKKIFIDEEKTAEEAVELLNEAFKQIKKFIKNKDYYNIEVIVNLYYLRGLSVPPSPNRDPNDYNWIIFKNNKDSVITRKFFKN